MSKERTSDSTEGMNWPIDMFSIRANCYALLYGKSPVAGQTAVETITKIRSATPLAPNTFQLGIPPAFEGAILKLLAKRPEERYQTATEMLAELARIGSMNGIKDV